MVILFDLSQIVISSAVDYFRKTADQVDLPLLRHIALHNILSYKKKFSTSIESFVICYDGKDYWRKDVFPLYKQNRKKDHKKSKFDWQAFYQSFNQIKKEIKEDLPFKAIEVYKCEADDVIAVLSSYLCPRHDKIVIVSSDKDLLQIQDNICNKVKQWSPFHKKFITSTTNEYSLFEHVIRGDGGDGIPNILSDDDVFLIDGKRSKPIKATNIMEWKEKGTDMLSESVKEKLKRNRILIDLREIPDNLKSEIVATYNGYISPEKDVFAYLIKNRLKKILEMGIL